MPLYVVIQCHQCQRFQSKQHAKILKFSCVTCGTLQTVQKIFQQSTNPRDLTKVVQELNMNLGEAQQQKEAELQESHEGAVNNNNTEPKTFHEQQAQFQAIRQEKKQREQYQQQESWDHCGNNDEVVSLPQKNKKYQQYAPPEIKPLTGDAAKRLYSNPTASIINKSEYSNQHHSILNNPHQQDQRDNNNNSTLSFATIDKPKTNAEYALELVQQRQFQREQWKDRRAAMYNNNNNTTNNNHNNNNNTNSQNTKYNQQNPIQPTQPFKNPQPYQNYNTTTQYDTSRERNRDYASNITDQSLYQPTHILANQNQPSHNPTITTTTQPISSKPTTKSLFGNKSKNQISTIPAIQPLAGNHVNDAFNHEHQHIPPTHNQFNFTPINNNIQNNNNNNPPQQPNQLSNIPPNPSRAIPFNIQQPAPVVASNSFGGSLQFPQSTTTALPRPQQQQPAQQPAPAKKPNKWDQFKS